MVRFSWRRALVALLIVISILLGSYIALFAWDASGGRRPTIGISFSAPHAQWLGLDWRATYTALLDDLQVRRIRLAAYWNWTEWPDDTWRFEELDWQLDEAARRGATVTLAIGRRLPRWPECHIPDWARSLPEARQREELLEYLRVMVERYRQHPALIAWQVENEPLLSVFGECPPGDRRFLEREVALVRSLDATHPMLITDSGELSLWMRTAAVGDRLGTTLYRVVWNPLVGYWSYDYLIPPALYRVKAWLAGKSKSAMAVAELQAEPWIPKGTLFTTPIDEQLRSMSPDRLRTNVTVAAQTGFPEVLLWGAEYWYWRKTTGNDPALWEAVRPFFATEISRGW